VKSVVYKSPVTGIDDLKKRIADAVMTVRADMLLRTWQEFEYREDSASATNTEV
jgi:hypothetical protein